MYLLEAIVLTTNITQKKSRLLKQRLYLHVRNCKQFYDIE